MKIHSVAVACLALVLLSGCESDLSDSVSSALGAREAPKAREFQGDSKAIYQAARTALDGMGYRFVHGGPAEGKIEALGDITGGEDSGSSRQLSVKLHIEPSGDGACTVTVSFTEIIEQNSSNQPGMATQTPLRDTPLYEVLFRNIQQALRAQAEAPKDAK